MTAISAENLPFSTFLPEHAEPAIDAELAAAQARLDAIRAITAGHTWENTAGAFDRATEPLDRTWTLIGHLRSVVHTDAWEQAYVACIPKVTAFYANIPLDTELFAALNAYASTPEAQALTGARRRFLDKTIADFRRSGADLDDAGKAKLAAIAHKLAELATTYTANVLASSTAWSLTLPDASRLVGVPEGAVAMTRAFAEAKGEEGYRVTLAMPVVNAILTYAEDRDLRETAWRAFQRRGAMPGHDNAPVLVQMLVLRRQQAELLGFADFADYVLADRMAKTGAAASAFVDRLEAAARPSFERETAELEAWAGQQGADLPLQPWDIGFWAERLRKERFDLDGEALRPYFVYDRVLQGMFGLAHQLFGITVTPSTANTWHPDVRPFDIQDENGALLGTFYADFFSRPHKRDGAWMNGVITGHPTADGGHTPHVGVICGDMMPPAGGRPSLLLHREVQTIFHEFGHLLHHLLTDAPLYRQAGTNVAWDFVELPSQILENWVDEREVLDLIARHVDTDERLPDDLFAKMKAAKTFRAATFMMRQLGFCRLDLDLHRSFDPSGDVDALDLSREILTRFGPAPLPPESAMVCGFQHLFADPVGYAAGYYSYQWAAVLDADAFGRFRREGLLSGEVGRAFRKSVLSVGDSVDPAEAFRAFVGRDPDLAAHLERSGLAA